MQNRQAMPLINQDALSGQSTETLWDRFALDRSTDCRNELLLRHIDLVRRVVSRLYVSTRYYHEYDDLLSCGVIGLMDAFSRFDPGRGIPFEAFAQVRIRGEIVDYMRRQDWAPSHLRQRIRQIEQTYDLLSQTLGRMPTEQEAADRLGIELTQLQQTLGDVHSLNVVSLDELLNGTWDHDSGTAREAGFDQTLERQERHALLRQEIERLSERDRLVLNLYYEDELTLKEIGQVLKLTESRISQIHSGVLLKLRMRLRHLKQ